MSKFSKENVERYAKAVMDLVNLMVYLASPRIVEAHGPIPDRDHVLTRLDEYIECVEGFGSSVNESGRDILTTVPFARKAREFCAAWQPSVGVPDDIQATARAFLAAFGIEEPTEGWDAFAGFPDQ